MSRVIKNDDGVTVVEGTPAASIVKDADRFFASKPPERMAGESISQPRKINKNNILSEKEYYQQFKDKEKEMGGRGRITPQRYEDYLKEQQLGFQEEKAAAIQKEKELIEQEARKRGFSDERRTTGGRPAGRGERHGRPVGGNPNRNEAKDKAESRRKRFFERARSRREAERSQREQEATQGKFITTLGR